MPINTFPALKRYNVKPLRRSFAAQPASTHRNKQRDRMLNKASRTTLCQNIRFNNRALHHGGSRLVGRATRACWRAHAGSVPDDNAGRGGYGLY